MILIKKTAFFSLLSLASFTAWAEECDLGPLTPLDTLVSDSKMAVKDLEAKPASIYDFCKEHAMSGRAPSFIQPGTKLTGLDSAYNESMMKQIREWDGSRTVKANLPLDYSKIKDPWRASMMPSLNIRLNYYDAMFTKKSESFFSNDVADTSELYRNTSTDHSKYKAMTKWELRDKLNVSGGKMGWKENKNGQLNHEYTCDVEKVGFVKGTAMKKICKTFEGVDPEECLTGVKKITAMMSTCHYISAMPLMRKISRDPIYAEGARRAAIKVMKKVEDVRVGKEVQGDWFSDIESSFIEAGQPSQKARDLAWDLMAVMATRGANILPVLAPILGPENSQLFSALQVMAIGAPVLDSARASGKSMYSLPKNVESSCDTGKSYHFWMSAYFARDLVKANISPKAAMAATHMTGYGYQMVSEVGDREPTRPFTQELFETGNQKIRMDLAATTAGVMHGLDPDQELSVDEGLQKLLTQAKINNPTYHPISKEAAKGKFNLLRMESSYKEWRQMFAPEAPFDNRLKAAY